MPSKWIKDNTACKRSPRPRSTPTGRRTVAAGEAGPAQPVERNPRMYAPRTNKAPKGRRNSAFASGAIERPATPRSPLCTFALSHFLTLPVFVCLCVGTALAAPPSKIALKGGTVITVSGETLNNATILVDSGLITTVGVKVEVPYDHIVYDTTGKVVFPGMVVAHAPFGMDQPNENLPVTPYLDVYDSIDPSQRYFEEALRDGHAALHIIHGNNCVIGALSRVVRPIGLSPEEMTIDQGRFLKISATPKGGFDRMLQMATLRETFLELDDYLEKLAEKKYEEKLKEDDKKIDVGPEEARKRGKELIKPEDYDDKHARLIELRDGPLGAFVYCGDAMDVGPAINFAKEHGFFDRTVFVIGPECYKAVAELRSAGRPVVIEGDPIYREQDPYTGKIKETFVPKVIADAGLTFALTPGTYMSLSERYLTYRAAQCVRYGVPRDVALKAITVHPAQMLGLEERLGSIQPGRIANLVVYSGDPLDFNAWVEKVFIDGIIAYDRDKDVRLKELLDTGDTAQEDRPVSGE